MFRINVVIYNGFLTAIVKILKTTSKALFRCITCRINVTWFECLTENRFEGSFSSSWTENVCWAIINWVWWYITYRTRLTCFECLLKNHFTAHLRCVNRKNLLAHDKVSTVGVQLYITYRNTMTFFKCLPKNLI